jgi:hypothetical protein
VTGDGRVVLEAVRPGVGVAQTVVRGRPVVVEIDAEIVVAVDRVVRDGVALSGVDGNAVLGVPVIVLTSRSGMPTELSPASSIRTPLRPLSEIVLPVSQLPSVLARSNESISTPWPVLSEITLSVIALRCESSTTTPYSFGSAALPPASRPITLRSTVLPIGGGPTPSPSSMTPASLLPDSRLSATTLKLDSTLTPLPLATATTPSASVPIRLPSTRWF